MGNPRDGFAKKLPWTSPRLSMQALRRDDLNHPAAWPRGRHWCGDTASTPCYRLDRDDGGELRPCDWGWGEIRKGTYEDMLIVSLLSLSLSCNNYLTVWLRLGKLMVATCGMRSWKIRKIAGGSGRWSSNGKVIQWQGHPMAKPYDRASRPFLTFLLLKLWVWCRIEWCRIDAACRERKMDVFSLNHE